MLVKEAKRGRLRLTEKNERLFFKPSFDKLRTKNGKGTADQRRVGPDHRIEDLAVRRRIVNEPRSMRRR